MTIASTNFGAKSGFHGVWMILASPVVVLFLASNFVNVGNLAFNMIFSRWMGPEQFGDLAIILTIKLAVLGCLASFQMAAAHLLSSAVGPDRQFIEWSIGKISKLSLLALLIVSPVLIALAMTDVLNALLGLGSNLLLPILVLALPFTVPLSLARGLVTGRVEISKIVVSANVEMLVRLGGAILAWQLGFGIVGVAVALAVSIVAGWFVIRGEPKCPSGPIQSVAPVLRKLAVYALPFAALQISQVVLLDGDVFYAKAYLSSAEAGYAAALSLIQRVQFFACFGLVSILLPTVSAAVASGGNGLREVAPVVALFAAFSVPLLIILTFAPGLVISVIVGSDFAQAAPLLQQAGFAAMAFTLSYLIATFLAAMGDQVGVIVIAAIVPVQLGCYALIGSSAGPFNLEAMVAAKMSCQLALCLALLGYTARKIYLATHNDVPATRQPNRV